MEPTLLEMILLIVFGAVAVAGALVVILARQVIYSALGMLANFVALGALYIMLSAEFLGIAQLIVYAGAVVVLFLFALMLVGGRRPVDTTAFKTALTAAGVLLGVVFLAEALFLLLGLPGIAGQMGAVTPAVIAEEGSIQLFGRTLLTDYLLPFELASVLLLVGIIGAVALGKGRRGA